jgi:hypothetical protein
MQKTSCVSTKNRFLAAQRTVESRCYVFQGYLPLLAFAVIIEISIAATALAKHTRHPVRYESILARCFAPTSCGDNERKPR